MYSSDRALDFHHGPVSAHSTTQVATRIAVESDASGFFRRSSLRKERQSNGTSQRGHSIDAGSGLTFGGMRVDSARRVTKLILTGLYPISIHHSN
jgi:hypothetical protein